MKYILKNIGVWPRYIQKISIVVVGTTSAGLALFFYSRMKTIPTSTLAHSSNVHHIQETFQPTLVRPCSTWDDNWDYRDPQTFLKPGQSSPTAVRHIFLIRHGEYYSYGETDSTHKLTERGKLQAKLAGKRLKDLNIKWNEVIISTMTRAQETGNIILNEIDFDHNKVQQCSFIQEGAPIEPQPPVTHWNPKFEEFYRDGARIEAGFRKYFYRADNTIKNDTYTLLVCHANVIRYFVCRALQFPAEGWLRLSLNHASITHLLIHPNGHVQVKLYGESGHMPANLITFRIPTDII